jgi:pimeloyl-ACP methyl ester carboxylesterase
VGEDSIGEERVHVEEIRFEAGKFDLVGDLRMPLEDAPHPAVIIVHGDGPITRSSTSARTMYDPVMEIFVRNGCAVLVWDKPGSGESTGQLMDVIPERAGILEKAVEVLVDHPAIDPTQIGMWGISQAGWVMPLALEETHDVAFMVVVAGGGEASVEQMAFQMGQRVICEGGSAEQAAIVDEAWARAGKARNYDEYRDAMEIVLAEPAVKAVPWVALNEKGDWTARPSDSLAFRTGTEVFEDSTIPVLVFFGELDTNVDPLAGTEAWEAALQKAGNPDSRVVLIPGVAHTLVEAETGCLNEAWSSRLAPEYLETLEDWIQQVTE